MSADRLTLNYFEQFQLVCEKNFIPSTTMTIQILGTLFGNLVAGQLGELFGRKRPFFFAVLVSLIGNMMGFFAPSWVVYAIGCFLNGFSAGAFMTMKYALLSEFSLADWRSWIIGFPSWPIEQAIFALCAWGIRDWRYIQLMNAVVCLVCLMAWW